MAWCKITARSQSAVGRDGASLWEGTTMDMPPPAWQPPAPPEEPAPKVRRQWWKAGWFIALVAALVGVGIGAAGGSTKTTTKTVAGPIQTATATVTATESVTATPTVIKTIATRIVTKSVVYTPPPPPPPRTVFDLSGSGQKNTSDFTVSKDEWVIHYSYDCSGFGGSGNFSIDVSSTDGGSADGDTPVNELGASGNSTSVERGAGTYYLQIGSECDWHITVTQ